jgi:hypothetical protein
MKYIPVNIIVIHSRSLRAGHQLGQRVRRLQAKRFQDRLNDPTKHWKFSYLDYNERSYWKDYTSAYEDALERTSTDKAPWYIVPSNHPWFRDLVVSQAIVNSLEDLGMKYPKLDRAKAGVAAARESS